MSDLGSDSDSDFAMDDVQEEEATVEALQTIKTLTESLESNPYQYNAYTEIIPLLKKQGMLDELRVTRFKMNTIYPMSEDLWLDWIQDEAKLADSDEEKNAVIQLYDKATAEYLSFPLWTSYTEYMVQGREEAANGNESTVFTVDRVRDVFSKAYDAVKWHISKSHLIWNAWLAFEKEALGENPSPDDVQRVRKMCMERVGVPHFELDKTFSEEISSFVSKFLHADYENTMTELSKTVVRTRKMLPRRLEDFEKSLIDTQNSIVAYRDYIKYQSHPSNLMYPILRTLFERAVQSHPLVTPLWDEYLTMLMNTRQTGFEREQVIQACVRAVRNCPWSGALWAKYITILGIYLKTKAEVADVFERAIQDPTLSTNAEEVTKVCLEYCSFLRRFITSSSSDEQKEELRQALAKSQQVIQAAGGDPYYKLERFWINVEAFVLNNPTNARSKWNTILDTVKTSASTWLESISMELRLGDYEKARRLFRIAANTKKLDWPTTILDSWMSFEQQHGGIDEVKAVYLVMSRQAGLDQYITQMYNSGTSEPEQQSVATDQYAVEEHSSSGHDGKKRKASADHGAPTESAAPSGTPSESQAGNGADSQRPAKQQKPAATHHASTGREEDTCFFKNFSPEISTDDLQALFAQYGTLTRFSIPIDKVKKTRKGYGYAQFSNKSEAQAALALNGHDCGWNRGLIVQISDVTRAPARSQAPPPRPTESAHDLEVTGFDNDLKEADLRKLFSLHGELKDVRIFRKSKVDGLPFAKVTFAKEDDALKALDVNGTSYMTHVLKVQQWKNQSQTQFNKNVEQMESQANAAKTSEGASNTPRIVTKATGFRPRALSAKKVAPPRSKAFVRPTGPSEQASTSVSTTTASTDASANQAAEAPVPKSQDDFRRWLQQKREQAP